MSILAAFRYYKLNVMLKTIKINKLTLDYIKPDLIPLHSMPACPMSRFDPISFPFAIQLSFFHVQLRQLGFIS